MLGDKQTRNGKFYNYRGFNPLFIGACWATTASFTRVAPFVGREVSIPSSSGHVRATASISFATVPSRSRVSIPSSSGHVGRLQKKDSSDKKGSGEFQSPLHRGMLGDIIVWEGVRVPPPPLFQSPLHRGMLGDFWGLNVCSTAKMVSIPSSSGHVGRPRRAVPTMSATEFVSIPSSSGHVGRLTRV